MDFCAPLLAGFFTASLDDVDVQLVLLGGALPRFGRTSPR
jgi:hypothetical protein